MEGLVLVMWSKKKNHIDGDRGQISYTLASISIKFYSFSQVQEKLKDFAGALQTYNRAASMNSTPLVRFKKAKTLIMLKQYQVGVSCFTYKDCVTLKFSLSRFGIYHARTPHTGCT